jgi:hypothetical protein
VIALKTQTPAYWQDEFSVIDTDLEYLHQLIVDAGKPVSADELVSALVANRCHQEIEAIRGDLDKGKMYQPRDAYAVGDTLLFPAFGFAIGTVTGSRAGYDPAHGEFEVVEVRFDKTGETREFASQLTSPHALNRDDGDDGLDFLRDLVSPGDLVKQYGDEILAKLRRLLSDTELSGFVEHRSRWMVQELMADVHVGHRNIAEAIIDVSGVPMSTEQVLKDVDLPAEIDPMIQAFSLNAALDADERFDDVGWDGQVRWFLTRLQPADVLSPPVRLKWFEEQIPRGPLSAGLLAIENEIDDESADHTRVSDLEITPYTAQITLTYPHLRSGTLPLSAHVRALFPKGSFQHTRVELIDGQSGEAMVGWMNHTGGYVSGLGEWYSRHQIPAGGFIRLERSKQPGVVLIDFDRRRMRREWVRVADVRDGSISFGMQKRPIACVHDELMTIDHMDAARLDAFVAQLYDEERSLTVILREVVPELIKLSPGGTVHAKTIYAGVNAFRRCSPGPVFSLLSAATCYIDMGSGMWAFQNTK